MADTVFDMGEGALSSIALERIQPIVDNTLINEHDFLRVIEKTDVIKKRKYPVVDDKYIIPTTIRVPAGARGVARQTSHPEADVSDRVRFKVRLKKHMIRSLIEWESTRVHDKEAYLVETLAQIMDDCIVGFDDVFGSGLIGWVGSDASGNAAVSGALAEIHSVDGTTVTLKLHDGDQHISRAPGSKLLREGMRVMTCDADTGLSGKEYSKIASITDLDTIELDDSHTLAGNDIIVPGDNTDANDVNHQLGNSLTSLYQHLNDDTGTYQGLSRNTYKALKGNVMANAGVSRALTDRLINDAYARPRHRGYKKAKFKMILCHTSMVNEYNDLYDDKVRYTIDATKGTMGTDFRNVRFPGGKQAVEEPRMWPGSIAFLCPDDFEIIYTDWFEWEKIGGKVLMYIGTEANKQIFTMRCINYSQFICKSPANQVLLADLSDPPYDQ